MLVDPVGIMARNPWSGNCGRRIPTHGATVIHMASHVGSGCLTTETSGLRQMIHNSGCLDVFAMIIVMYVWYVWYVWFLFRYVLTMQKVHTFGALEANLWVVTLRHHEHRHGLFETLNPTNCRCLLPHCEQSKEQYGNVYCTYYRCL